jgi:inner membrane protein
MRSIDYRFVLLGSLLPDIIDKPIWIFTNANFPWNGRGYAHTFLFNFVLLIAGLILTTRWNKIWLLTISLCSFIHLVLDQMWLDPTTLWWPFLGPIQREATAGWLLSLWSELISNPYVYVSEAVGLIITLYIALRLVASRRGMHFLKTGDIDLSK